jgi:hypothetical protein
MIELMAESVPIPDPPQFAEGSVSGLGTPGAMMLYHLTSEGSIPFTIVYGTTLEAALGLRRAILADQFGPGDRAYLVDLNTGLVTSFEGTTPA